MNTARFNLFLDSLRTALISEIGAENGALILRQVTKESQLSLFRYFDKGNLAVVLKNFALLQSGCVMMSDFLAWLVWVLIHIQFLAEGSRSASFSSGSGRTSLQSAVVLKRS
jgi:NADH dehydrogenase FAD-containing subunit